MKVEERNEEEQSFEERCRRLVSAFESEKSLIPHIFVKQNLLAGAGISPGQNVPIDVERFDREKSGEWLAYVNAASTKFPNVAKKCREALDFAEGVWKGLAR